MAAAAQLLQAAIDIFKSFKQAYDRQQDQAEFLERYQLELLAIKEQVENVEKEKALQIASVIATLRRLKGPEERLVKWLQKEVDQGDKKAIRRFVDQLIHGTKGRKKLEDIMDELSRIKVDLITAISVALAEGTRRIEKKVDVNNERMHKINQKLVSGSSNAGGQGIPKKRQTRPKSECPLPTLCYQSLIEMLGADSSAQFNDSGVSSNRSEDGRSTDGSEASANFLPDQSDTILERIVTGNSSDSGAIMLNARVGPDEWKECRLKISKNTAKGRSFMLNYPNDLGAIESLVKFLDRREEKALQRKSESSCT